MTEKFKELRAMIDRIKYKSMTVVNKTSKSGRISKVALLEETITLINTMEAEAVRLAAQNRLLEGEFMALVTEHKSVQMQKRKRS